MSLKALADRTLARLGVDETARETEVKHAEQAEGDETKAGACFTPMKHGKPQNSAISGACFTVSSTRDGNSETRAIVSTWRDGLASLDPDKPRNGIPLDRWRRMLLDADAFLTDWGSQAVAFGWTDLDLFGCSRGFARRLDRDGLVIGLHGRIVVAMTADSATIDGGGGGKPTRYYRMERLGAVTWWTA